jgi:hypothetical protein
MTHTFKTLKLKLASTGGSSRIEADIDAAVEQIVDLELALAQAEMTIDTPEWVAGGLYRRWQNLEKARNYASQKVDEYSELRKEGRELTDKQVEYWTRTMVSSRTKIKRATLISQWAKVAEALTGDKHFVPVEKKPTPEGKRSALPDL